MSFWTYINGTIELDVTGVTQAQKEYVLKTVLDHLPVVEGSEGDMEVHIVQRYDHNSFCGCDEYNNSTNNLIDSYGQKSRKRGWLKTQSIYFLMIDGFLRDRTFKGVYKDFIKWLTRLSKRIIVNDVFIKIEDDCGDKTIINTDKFSDMYEYFDWDGSQKENWTQHLLWQCNRENKNYRIM